MKCDFITATFRGNPGAKQKVLGLLSSEAAYRTVWGATGYDDKDLFVGEFPDARVMVNAYSGRAEEVMKVLMNELEGDFSIARLDVQYTCIVTDADAVIRSGKPHPRYKSTLMASPYVEDRGATLYVGAPRSRKRLRVYNKTAQANLDSPLGDYLRAELQLRDENADFFFVTRRRSEEDFVHLARNTMCAMLPDLESIIPETEMAHIDVPAGEKTNNYAYWLEHSVLPGIMRARFSPDPLVQEAIQRIKDALSF